MGIISYNGTNKTLVVRCKNCQRNEEPEYERTVNEEDVQLNLGRKVGAVKLPACPVCGSVTISLPGQIVGDSVAHMRAVLLRRRYEAAGGDSDSKLAICKQALDTLSLAYEKDATPEAQAQLAGGDFTSLNLTSNPKK